MQAENIRSRGVRFAVETDITEPCIEGDVTRIKQVLMNIVGNAAKFTPEGKWIKLSVNQEKTDDTHVTAFFRCEDAGIGISEEYIDRIFDSLSQERSRNTNSIKGAGLGMGISKRLVNAMGGDITVESELDVGSTFTVTIPALIVKEIPEGLKDTGPDDTGLQKILTSQGFETVWAKNGQAALELFQSSAVGEFDVILMDLQRPVMDDCTAAGEIRGLSRADANSVQVDTFDYVDEIQAIPGCFDTPDATDILYEGYFNMASYIHTGKVVLLDDIISDDLRKDIDDASWAMSMVNGKTYMMPFSSMQNVLAYNKTHFKSCGLEQYISDQEEI